MKIICVSRVEVSLMAKQAKIVEQHIAIVFLGEFNVLHHIPERLCQYGLINSEDLANTTVDIIAPSQLQITLPWGRLLVAPAGSDVFKLTVI